MDINNSYEKPFLGSKTIILGIDEVGRGALAGPMVAAGVIWDWEKIASWNQTSKNVSENKSGNESACENLKLFSQIKDSKKLSLKKREILSKFITDNCLDYEIVEVSSAEIDKNGVGEANKKVFIQVIENIKKRQNIQEVLIDYLPISLENTKITAFTKGEDRSISIASASIIAKVYRDNLMKIKYHKQYPEYGFDKHVGYGVLFHLLKIKELGICPIHRKSYKLKKG